MCARQYSRKTARQNSAAHNRKPYSLYRRTLRCERLEDRWLLAVVTVTTLADTIDFNDGRTSLREAIFAVNTVPGADTINFASSLTANGPGTILLTQGELKITESLTINGPGTSLLTIDASGSDPTPEQDNRDGSRVFNINDGRASSLSEVTLAGLTLTGGDTSPSGSGGGAITSSENLSLIDSTVSGNSAFIGGGIYSGGSGGRLTIIRSLIQNNSARTNGGGLFVRGFGGRLDVTDSVVSNNTAGQDGGGVFATGATTNINGTLIGNNYASRGGGGVQADGSLTINDSSIINNSSNEGIATVVPYGGGGILASGNVAITASTISGNLSKSIGGGLFCWGTTTITGCIITGNSASVSGGGIQLGTGNQTITNSVIRGNSAGGGGGGISSHGSLVVTNSAISGNAANDTAQISSYRNGGGIRSLGSLTVFGTTISGNSSKYDGGGVWSGSNAKVTIANSTVSGNSASNGGGVWVTTGASISDSTVASNTAQTLGGGLFVQGGILQLRNSIVAENLGPLGPNVTGLVGAMITATYSLLSWNAESGLAEAPVGSPDANGNLIGGSVHHGISPLLGPLVDNGGFTLPDGSHIQTRALMSGSPATNAGDPLAVAGTNRMPTNDQRGAPFTRVYGGRIDIGAVEFQPTDRLLGDFNRDGVVDAGDYTIGRKQSGLNVAPGTGADANADGKVDDADLAIWRSSFGMTYASATTSAARSSDEAEAEAPLPYAANQSLTTRQTPSEEPWRSTSVNAVPATSLSADPAIWRADNRDFRRLRRPSSSTVNRVIRTDAALEDWFAPSESSNIERVRAATSLTSGRSDCVEHSGELSTSLGALVDAVFGVL